MSKEGEVDRAHRAAAETDEQRRPDGDRGSETRSSVDSCRLLRGWRRWAPARSARRRRPRAQTVGARVLEVGGRPATVFGSAENGRSGIDLARSEGFDVRVVNEGPEPTIIH